MFSETIELVPWHGQAQDNPHITGFPELKPLTFTLPNNNLLDFDIDDFLDQVKALNIDDGNDIIFVTPSEVAPHPLRPIRALEDHRSYHMIYENPTLKLDDKHLEPIIFKLIADVFEKGWSILRIHYAVEDYIADPLRSYYADLNSIVV